MSKSKEQCINIIAKRFSKIVDEENPKALSLIMEESIKEISESEYGLLWIYEEDTLINLAHDLKINMTIGKSLFKSVVESKKSLFDNHIASHKLYNQLVDNPFKIRIKSMLIVPLMDRVQEKIVGFISVFNSVKNGGEFQRYDIRSLALLNSYALKIIALRNAKEKNLPLPHFNNDILLKSPTKSTAKTGESKKKPASKENTSKVKEKKIEKNIPSDEVSKLKNELKSLKSKLTKERNKNEDLMNKSQQKIELLEKRVVEQEYSFEKELLRKNKLLNELEKKSSAEAVDLIEKSVPASEEIQNIINFLNNEVSYLADEAHQIYLFLEIIKNSLYNKEQLLFIEEMLKQSELIDFLANELYTREKMPVFFYEFTPLQTFYSVANLYSRSIFSDNINYNVFIDPQIPAVLISDEDKIKSLLIHLMNNVHGLVNEGGTIEFLVSFSEKNETLEIKIQGLIANEKTKNRGFFKKKKEDLSHSLVSADKGLGLSVSSGLIHHLDGKLKLETLEENGKSFSVLLPVQTSSLYKTQTFLSEDNFKIGILMSKEHEATYKNLERYFEAFEISSSNITIFENHRQIAKTKLTHLFCFENLYTEALKEKNIEELILLKNSHEIVNDTVEELFYNGYYGTTLQKILFPNMETEELKIETKLFDDSFLTKLNKVVKKLKAT